MTETLAALHKRAAVEATEGIAALLGVSFKFRAKRNVERDLPGELDRRGIG